MTTTTKVSATLAVVTGLLCAVSAVRADPSAVGGVSLPPALRTLRAFRGTITYIVARDGTPGALPAAGSLTIGDGWTLDERSPRYDLHADGGGAWLTFGAASALTDDIVGADPLGNAWAVALGIAATTPLRQAADGVGWAASGRAEFYLDPTGARLVGLADRSPRGRVAFSFDDSMRSGGLDLPRHVLRMRDGMPDAAFTVSQYVVTPAALALASPAGAPMPGAIRVRVTDPTTLVGASGGWSSDAANGLERSAIAAAIALVALLVLWSRRAPFVLWLCRRMAADKRGWRRAGISIFVGPDGALLFDGLTYRVGPHFYGRATLVQTSALFLRISAPGVPSAVIRPRKFRPIDLGIRSARAPRRQSAGFTLIEAIIATALFAAVIMLAIYPALVALSRADALAQRRALAVVIAQNALTDEQAAGYYEPGAPLGTTVTQVDGLTLTVSVSPSPQHGIKDLDIAVADADGDALAHVVSLLGPSVAAPPHSGGGPPGG